MYYSAEAWTLYDGYVKRFGADIDIKAFWELYLGREERYRVRNKLSDGTKIPKGMDLNFLRPKTELERKIQDLVATWKGSTPLCLGVPDHPPLCAKPSGV